MYKLCVFAGTADGRALIRWLAPQAQVLACAATEYGGELLEEIPGVEVSAGRLDREAMEALFRQRGFDCVVDATHPYAPIVTENIHSACAETATPYLRLTRDGGVPENCLWADSTAQAVELLKSIPGNIFLTTGSKELKSYTALPDFAQRVYARVLPVEGSMAACREAGLPAAHTYGMQGPFSEELNIAMLHACEGSILVTKQTGAKGGFWEKVEAAKKANCTLLVIGRPESAPGLSFGDTVRELCRRFDLKVRSKVTVVGIGPGDRGHETLAAREAIAQADCLIGAARMLEAVASPGQLKVEAIAPESICGAIESHPECEKFAVVMAGDVGFYSGTKKLLPLLSHCQVTLEPGLSSLVVLCSRLGVSYEDVFCLSLHGREGDIAGAVNRHGKVFALVGGEDGMKNLCQRLTDAGLGHVEVAVGERLGYPEERITRGTARELSQGRFDKLSVALITGGGQGIVTQGLPDETFRRGSHADGTVVPMTKSEVRAVALSKLGLTRQSVCWDIGAGTGSVAIEMAMQADLGHTYAVEKKPEALALLQENARRLHVANLTAVEALAPQGCEDLPAPTHVFIGGSSGNMESILKAAWAKNPNARIVAAAVALETVAELTRLTKTYPAQTLCLTVAQAHKVGPYTMMQGQNPIYLFTFN